MLDSTFIHCQGIGAKTERKLWTEGVRTWEEFLLRRERLAISSGQRSRLEPRVQESLERLATGDYAWFAQALPQREHWRAYPAFKERAVFLDIETTGGMEPHDLTVVGLYDGQTVHQFVRGFNLEQFPVAIRESALIVTFFGAGFDLPFLRRAYRMDFPQLHVDLCFLLRRLGYSGGLKHVEGDFGIQRSAETRGLTGWDAVRLWNEHRRGNPHSLRTLLAYNAEDVVNLKTLIESAYPMVLAKVWS
jgi:uncharacterized protein